MNSNLPADYYIYYQFAVLFGLVIILAIYWMNVGNLKTRISSLQKGAFLTITLLAIVVATAEIFKGGPSVLDLSGVLYSLFSFPLYYLFSTFRQGIYIGSKVELTLFVLSYLMYIVPILSVRRLKR